MSDFSQSDLANLWVQAGGNASQASLMAAIAMAESGGNPDAQNPSSGACGLWQINPAQSGCNNPFTNAQMAVQKYNSQGLSAWQAYTNGSYKQFYGSGTVTLSSDSSGCRLATVAGICIDGIAGLGAVTIGSAFVLIGIAVLVANAQILAPLRKFTEDATKTAAVVVPK